MRYVGQTSVGLARPYRHKLLASSNVHLNNWIKSLLKKSVCYQILIIEDVEEQKLNDREIFWIAFYKAIGTNLLNATDGGGGIRGFKFSLDTKRKMSASRLGRKHPPRSKESIERLSAALKDSPLAKAAREKAHAARRGKPPAQECIDRIRAYGKLPKSESVKRKMSIAAKGKRKSPEQVRKSVQSKALRRTKRYILDIMNSLKIKNNGD